MSSFSRRCVMSPMARALISMLLEERELLPLAEQVLTSEDWDELDAAFAADQDPLSGGAPDAEYVALFTRIVNLVPAPLGLGPARTP